MSPVDWRGSDVGGRRIGRCASTRDPGWLEMREALWPHASRPEHLSEMQAFFDEPDRFAAFVAHEEPDGPAGFAEASIRRDYVNGTHTSPVGFLEGIYVLPGQRRKGIATALVASVSAWAKAQGCTELASDSECGNEASRQLHMALGFRETERVVFFCRQLADGREP